MSGAMTQFDT